MRKLAPALALLAGMVQPSASQPSGSETLTGHVIDTQGEPVIDATVIVESSPVPQKVPALAGRIDLRLGDDREVRLTVTAPGFVARHLNVKTTPPKTELGNIVLAPLPGVRIVQPQWLGESNTGTRLDFILVNDGADAPLITQLRLDGLRVEHTSCLDLATPDVTVDLTRAVRIRAGLSDALHIGVKAGHRTDNFDGGFIRFTRKPCKADVIDLSIPFKLGLGRGERCRIALIFPTTTLVQGKLVDLDLPKWAHVRMSVSWLLAGDSSETSAVIAGTL